MNTKPPEIIDLLRRLGGPTTNAVLDPSTLIFKVPEIDGLLGYKIHFGCAVVFGDPVCADSDTLALMKAFETWCKEKRLKIVYNIASEPFAKFASQHGYLARIEFGQEIVIDPHHDPRKLTGNNASLVRRKVRHAEKEGVSCLEYVEGDLNIESKMETVADLWLKEKKGPQIYMASVSLFSNRPGKRWFYAKKGDEIVGVVMLNRLQKRQGWLLNHLMITPNAPGGVPEILVITAIDTLKNEGCHHLTCGSVPCDTLGEILGPSQTSIKVTRFIFHVAKKIFRLHGKYKFWEKFDPTLAPSYLLFHGKSIGIKPIGALIRSMNTF